MNPSLLDRDPRVIEKERLQNFTWVRQHLVQCLKEFLVVDYRPGEVWYNHNEYPALPHRKIDESDAQRFSEYRAHGVEIVKLHQEWADWLGICGGDWFTSNDPKGLQELIKLAHSQRIQLHVYISSGFIDVRHPDFRPEWSGTSHCLNECYWRAALCSPLSAEWRGYLLKRLREILDLYDVDGLYNDCGFHNRFHPWWRPLNVQRPNFFTEAFEDTLENQPSFEDLLGEIYALLKEKRPAGLVTLHYGGNRRPPIRCKYYDRLYVGEGVETVQELCADTKNFDPPTMLIPDARLGKIGPRAVYAGGLPYFQFPVLYDGVPITGERAFASGVDYLDPEKDYWQNVMKQIRELRKQGAPPTYGWWDSVPGRPETKPTYYHFLKLWKKIARNGTRVFMEVELERCWQTRPRHVVQSLFVNDAIYMVIANYGSQPANLVPLFESEDLESEVISPAGKAFTIDTQDLKILRISRRDDFTQKEPSIAFAPHVHV